MASRDVGGGHDTSNETEAAADEPKISKDGKDSVVLDETVLSVDGRQRPNLSIADSEERSLFG